MLKNRNDLAVIRLCLGQIFSFLLAYTSGQQQATTPEAVFGDRIFPYSVDIVFHGIFFSSPAVTRSNSHGGVEKHVGNAGQFSSLHNNMTVQEISPKGTARCMRMKWIYTKH